MSTAKDKIFKAIADPTRREIFHLLVLGSALSITQLSSHFDISRQGITKHIKILQAAKMISIQKQGREQICHGETKALEVVRDWLSYYDQYWNDKLNALEKHLSQKS